MYFWYEAENLNMKQQIVWVARRKLTPQQISMSTMEWMEIVHERQSFSYSKMARCCRGKCAEFQALTEHHHTKLRQAIQIHQPGCKSI